MVGVLTPWKLANASNQDPPTPIPSLLLPLPAYSHPFKIHQHIPGANDGNFRLPRKVGQRNQLPLFTFSTSLSHPYTRGTSVLIKNQEI